MAVLVEEGLRRLRNASRGQEWEVSRKVMKTWSQKLKRCGYPSTVRHQIIKTAITKWEQMCADEDAGVRPIHRSRNWKARARKREKELKVTSWHKPTGPSISPLYLGPYSWKYDVRYERSL